MFYLIVLPFPKRVAHYLVTHHCSCSSVLPIYHYISNVMDHWRYQTTKMLWEGLLQTWLMKKH